MKHRTIKKILFALIVSSIISMVGLGFMKALDARTEPEYAKSKRAGPKLFIKNPLINLGLMDREVKTRKISFELENRGSSQLVFSKIQAGCPCLNANLGKTSLAPGEKTTLTASVPTLNIIGEYKDAIYLYCNDPDRKVTKLTIKGFMESHWSVLPDKLSLSNLLPDGVVDTTLTVLGPVNDTEFKIKNVFSSAPEIKIAGIKHVGSVRSRNQAKWEVGLIVHGRGQSSWKEHINIATTNKKKPTCKVPIHVSEIKPVIAEPRLIILTPGQNNTIVKEVNIISNRPNTPLEIASIRCPKWIRSKQIGNKEQPANKIRIQLTARVKAPSKLTRDKIMIEFTNGDSVEIPVIVLSK